MSYHYILFIHDFGHLLTLYLALAVGQKFHLSMKCLCMSYQDSFMNVCILNTYPRPTDECLPYCEGLCLIKMQKKRLQSGKRAQLLLLIISYSSFDFKKD